MKKWLIGSGIIVLAAIMMFRISRNDSFDVEPQRDISPSKTHNAISPAKPAANAFSSRQYQNGVETAAIADNEEVVVTKSNSSMVDETVQVVTHGEGSEETPKENGGSRAFVNWPAPAKSRFVGKTIGYRSVELPPNEKGGKPGELREWLIEPEEGYTAHVEEEYRPDENGEMQLIAMNQYVANQVLLTLDGEVSFDEFKAQLARKGAIVKAPLMELEKGAKIVAVAMPDVSFDAVENLRLGIKEYMPQVSVSFDPIETIDRTPNDARYSSQWGLTKIQAPSAWDTRTDASSVVIAVIDSGVNYNHPDLAGNMWVKNSSASATNYKYGMRCLSGTVTGNPLDDNGHGSHCAGIIGAVGNNSTGVSGVAWRAKIMACKSLSSTGSGSVSDRIICMEWARTNGASIVSMSLGAKRSPISEEFSAFQRLRDSGIIAVCAAGNDGDDNELYPHYPSSYDLENIVSVAASTSSDGLASFSCYGSTSVDIAAPGDGILSTVDVASYGQYESWSGTSMATPFVAGALALVKAQYPSYTSLQLIQRLYAGGDTLSALSGKCTTGKRLNVYKALTTTQLVSPVPVASKGTYSDRVSVTWSSVSGASYYRVYRATSSTGSKTALGSWQSSTTYNDYSATPGTTYYYWVCAATSSSGANQSTYGSYSTGYSQAQTGDNWDPGDDAPSGATSITPSTSLSTHGTHTLSGSDHYDFFKIYMTAGTRYTFATTGSMDTYGELFDSTSTNSTNRVAYNDDADGSNNRNFRIEYTPDSSATYYLRVRAYSVGSAGTYSLTYQRAAALDTWDSGDDTPSGGTLLTPTTTVQTHGAHTLSPDDLYDFFRISMTAGRKYVFESTGTSDMYGELFNSTSTNAANRVAYNDDIDGSNNRNFKIEYTPASSQTFYLRVRKYSVGSDGSYSLKYSYEASAPDLVFCRWKTEWPDSVFISKDGSTTPQTTFEVGDTITISYQCAEAETGAFPGPLTNCAKIVNQATGATRYTWQNLDDDGLDANTYMWSSQNFSGIEAGAYTMRFALNEDKNGNHSVVESNYDNNVREISFTVVNPQKTLTSIAISGNATIASKTYADYRCIGTYSDGSTADVSPTWSISSGSSYATVNSSGRVTAGDTTVDKTIVLRAEFGGKNTTKTITIRGYAVTPDPEDDYDPFGPIVSYPRAPMIVEGVLYINNVLATADDMIAAYSGNEVRGIASTDSSGRFTMGVNIAEANERISFKAYDASEGDYGTVFNCLQTLLGSSDPQGTVSDPVRFDALGMDPFGQVVREPLVPPTIIEASVSIDGETASSGDILAVFSGNTIVGKASVVYDNQNGHESATCSIVMYYSGRKTLSFKLWDADAEEILESSATLTLSSGDVEGTASSPYVIDFSLDMPVPCPVSLRSGWNLVSFSALPDSPTPANIFSEVSSSVQYVCDVQGKLWSPSSSNPSLSVIRLGEGYWVRSSSTGASWNVEGRGNPDAEISLAQGWNLVGYTLSRAGLVANVMRTALATGKIQYITDQNGNVYPGGTLSSIQPGVGYWVRATGAYTMKFDSDGMETATESLAMSMESSLDSHPFGTPITRVGMPTIFDNVTVTLFGKPAAYGDYLAVFDRNTDELLAVQQINTENGTLMFTIMGLGRNDKLYFKVWNAASGLYIPEIFTAPQSNDLTIISPDDPVVGLNVAITGTKPAYTVNYDLGGKATRTGGGALSQSIAFGGNATDPLISVNSGWRFVDWNYSKRTDIRCNMTITAIYEASGVAPSTYTVTLDRQGGSGGTASVTATYGSAMPAIDVPNRQNYAFGGYFSGTNGSGTRYYNADGTSACIWDVSGSSTLFAYWIYSGGGGGGPANDEYVNSEVLTGESGSVSGTTVNATVVDNEFLNGLFGSMHTIWYRWVAPKSGYVTFNTAGSTFDTVIGVLEEVGTSGAISLGANDDVRDGVTTSAISFNAVAGTGYRISVGGYQTDSGSVQLGWSYSTEIYTVTFNANGGRGTMQPQRFYESVSQDLRRNVFTRSGWTFMGWSTEKTGTVEYYDEDYVEIYEDTTLYAVWGKPFTVKVKDGLVGDMDEDEMYSSITAYNGSELLLSAMDKSSRNQIFTHWTWTPANANLGYDFDARSSDTVFTLPAANVSFTANYASNPGYISFDFYAQNDTANEVTEDDETDMRYSIEWSIDGKVWAPAMPDTEYPVPSGKVSVKLRSTDPRWNVPATLSAANIARNSSYILRIPATRVTVVDAWEELENGATGTVTMNPASGQMVDGKSVTLTAKATGMSVFAYWVVDMDGDSLYYYTPTVKLAPELDAYAYAVFRQKSDVEDPYIDEWNVEYSENSMVGVAFSAQIMLDDEARPAKFSAKGLPPGLKLDATTGIISGVPTTAGTYAIIVTVTGGTSGRATSSCVIPVTIEPIPAWAQGSFSGYVKDSEGVFGSASLTITATGKISGKIALLGTNCTFTAASFAPSSRTEEEMDDEGVLMPIDLVIESVAKVGKANRTIELHMQRSDSAYVEYDSNTGYYYELPNAAVKGYFEGDAIGEAAMLRVMWNEKDKVGKSAATDCLSSITGVYTVSLSEAYPVDDEGHIIPSETYGAGYLSITIDAKGNAKMTGKLADGTSVSGTAPLVYDGDWEVGYRAFFYVAPSAYKGGSFFFPMHFGFDRYDGIRIIEEEGDIHPVWSSFNPEATSERASGGFTRDIFAVANYYDKLTRLDYYYSYLRLSTILPVLQAPYKYTYTNDSGRKSTLNGTIETYANYLLDQEGCEIWVNAAGTGFSALRASSPVQNRSTKEWSYDGVNDSALTISFTAATGIFKGSMKFWFDYESAYDESTGFSTSAHTSKNISYEGIVVQGLSGIYGYYLWDMTGYYDDPKTGREKTYKYKQSYPFLFEPESE